MAHVAEPLHVRLDREIAGVATSKRLNNYSEAVEMHMSKLTRDGIELYFEVHGSGPVLLLTHGYSSTSQMWRGQIEALSSSHTVVVWDMRGHGRSDYPADQAAYSEAHTVADMAALLDAVGAQSAIVGGLSLGGYMSLAFHRQHPERVRALLIIDTGPGFKKDAARTAWNATALQRAESLEREGLSVLKSASAERAFAVHRSADGLAKAARGMLTQHTPDVIESLPYIKVPSLVVVGGDDTPFLAACDYMAAKIPGAHQVVIPNAGHAANLDQPDAFNAAVKDFLKGSLP
jgi:pimeloyl-ACP methyl ester carboxylesterase